MSDQSAIGVFDSGLGGLTVVRAIRALMPDERIVYLGDTARVPYGNRSPETVTKFALEDMSFLLNCGVKTVLAACNTVSSVALGAMRAASRGVSVGGVIEPGARAAVSFSPERVMVLGTRGTVNSGAYARAVNSLDPSIRVESRSCPLFVPLVEEGILHGEVTRAVFDLYLSDVRNDPPDVLLLGCTHYPLLKDALSEYMPDSVRILDGAEACAASLKSFLSSASLDSKFRSGADSFFVTDLSCDFKSQARRFLGGGIENVEKAEL